MLCENPATAFQSPALVQWQVDKSQKDDKRRSVSIPPRHPCFPLNIPRRRFIVRHIEIKLHVGKLLEHCSCPLLFVFRVASSSSSWTRRSAGGRASASTSASGAHARSAGGRASASTSTKGANARSAGARASASTSASGVDARSAGGRASASTSASGAHARSAGGRASASTSAKGANARNAGA